MIDYFSYIPDIINELQISCSRSSGPGGQNVNKVNSKVEIRFDINASQVFSTEQKEILLIKLASRVNSEGILRVVSQKHRSQLSNKEEAINKLNAIILKALTPAKRRKKTNPTKASIARRLNDKKVNSSKKIDRQKPLE